MLPIKRRVKKASFSQIMKEGFFIHGTSLYLRILVRKDEKPSLFSFVVPNKVKKTSVGRHLIKRQMSAVVENLLTTLKPGFSAIFFAKKDITDLPSRKTEEEVTTLLEKAGILE